MAVVAALDYTQRVRGAASSEEKGGPKTTLHLNCYTNV
jgi:hypothetical protein